jgi:hypothetical protein
MGVPAGYGPEYGPGYGPMGAAGSPAAMTAAARREKRTTRLAGIGVALGGVVLALGFLAVKFGLRAGIGALIGGTGLVPAATPIANAGPTPIVTQTYVSSLTTLGAANWVNDGHCAPKADGYHIVGNYVCSAPFGTSTNLDLSVRVKQTSGTILAPYGIVWRATESGRSVATAYEFAVDANGKWVFMRAAGGKSTQVVPYTAAAAIKRGLGATNTLEVRAQGATFTFFVNGKQVGKATDATIAAGGRCGLAGFTGIEVVFSDFSLKLLK